MRAIGRDQGVRYVVEDSVLLAEDRVRVNAQLVAADTGAHLWADRFDKPRRHDGGVLQVQDEIVGRLARAVGLQMVEAEARRAEREHPDQGGTAQDYVLRARAAAASQGTMTRDGIDSSIGVSHKHVVGRDQDVLALARLVERCRFVTVLGPGGIGKTTVALKVGQSMLDAFAGSVRFVDLGPVSDPMLVPTAVASALGILVQSSEPVSTLISYFRDKRILIVLDSCEHVVNTVSSLAETIFSQASQMHLLVTSREKLRAQRETVYQLPPLAVPPEDPKPSAAQALASPAVQLFVDRVQAGGTEFGLTDADAPIVADICRKLDGMALAIELAAGRVHAYGVRQTARLLDGQFKLLLAGSADRLAAPPDPECDAGLELRPAARGRARHPPSALHFCGHLHAGSGACCGGP